MLANIAPFNDTLIWVSSDKLHILTLSETSFPITSLLGTLFQLYPIGTTARTISHTTCAAPL